MSDSRSVSRRDFLALAAVATSAAVHAQAPPVASTGIVTLLFSMTVKPDRVQEFAGVAQKLTTTTRADDVGCIAYVFLQQEDNPREYVLYEQLEGSRCARLDAHLGRLQEIFGPSASGRGLPPALLDFFVTTRIVRYRVVG